MNLGHAGNEAMLNQRLKQANVMVQDPTCTLKDVAVSWGVSTAAASVYLNRHDSVCAELFRERQIFGNQFTAEEALFRLKFMKSQRDKGVTWHQIATLLGISHPALKQWRNRWCPDSMEIAIKDLEDD